MRREGIVARGEGTVVRREGTVARGEGIVARGEGIVARGEGIVARGDLQGHRRTTNSLVPKPFPEKRPGDHCLRMRVISTNPLKTVYFRKSLRDVTSEHR